MDFASGFEFYMSESAAKRGEHDCGQSWFSLSVFFEFAGRLGMRLLLNFFRHVSPTLRCPALPALLTPVDVFPAPSPMPLQLAQPAQLARPVIQPAAD